MHTEMWRNPATIANVELLRSRGFVVVGPGFGALTGSDVGAGRMSEPEEIVATALATVVKKDLTGVRLLVTAGGTREPLDPVRFIGNRSSGKQGVAIAAAAVARGATVTLVGANLDVSAPANCRNLSVSSTAELKRAVEEYAPHSDVIVMAAAVADYRPQDVSDAKLTKEDTGDRMQLSLIKNPDILLELSTSRLADQVVIGFAAETETSRENLLERGRAKIARKGCDFLVVNAVGWNTAFGTDENSVLVLDRAGEVVSEANGSKMSVANSILDLLSKPFI
jgi:phosphopantothenoylcysteine decarboxylase/phosphopantothenate--cysteine ligase